MAKKKTMPPDQKKSRRPMKIARTRQNKIRRVLKSNGAEAAAYYAKNFTL